VKTVRLDAGPPTRRRAWRTKCLVVFALNLVPTILAGHGYDVGGSSRESDGDDGVAGISMAWILAATGLTLVTVGLLVWLNPSSRASRKLKAIAPELGLAAVLIAAPLVAWQVLAETTENSPSLMVERVATGLSGGPELLVSLGEDDLNTLRTTNGKKVVRVECVGREGEVVLAARHKWPFVDEAGYDYPHAHQPASRDDLRRADRCRLRGTTHRLEADVEGVLPRSAL
jgi:hypothetical protein